MAKRKSPRSHTFAITVTFDKGVRVATALREIRDCIHGEFYCSEFDEGDPGSFKVRAIHRQPTRRRA